MRISYIDQFIIIAYLLISMGIGIYMSRKAGRSTGDFFLSGRKLPWFIAGTSMVATTFAADTPLAVTELVAKNGIAGNWLWWNMLFGGMLTVFFFARLWRRSDILTDAEFVSIRYSGYEARFLRGFRAWYIGIGMNAVVMAWVNLAMVKILRVIFPELTLFGIKEADILGITFTSHELVVGLMMLFVAAYSALSGLWGVSLADSFQFVIAMGGSITLAAIALKHVGGITNLKSQLAHVDWIFDFFPDIANNHNHAIGSAGVLKMSFTGLIAYLGVQWWASWYPGAEPGGGGYVAQRMMSAKNEKHSLLATLWFQIAHYALRPWPWIIVALVTLILYPNAPDKGETYVMAIRDLLPSGLLGFLLAAFLAAYMSTIASHTVWGTSYIVNDFIKPLYKERLNEKTYVVLSRISAIILIVISFLITSQLQEISGAWKFILACSGGIGLVLILRWYWWRISAWSEIAAMTAPFLVYPILYFHFKLNYENSLLIVVGWSTLVWIIVTLLTRPTQDQKLKEFYLRVHPGGKGWKKISDRMPDVKGDSGYLRLFVNYICGCILVMLSLFGVGKMIFHEFIEGSIYFIIALAAGAIIYFNLSRTGWKKTLR
jgi:Na+/proline symporter